MSESIAESFGESTEPVVIKGKTFYLQELDIDDLIAIEKFAGQTAFDLGKLDADGLERVKFILWLILRKGDSDLTDEERRKRQYRMTKEEVGYYITMSVINTHLPKILQRSGFLTQNEATPGNAVGEKVAP